MTEMLQRPSQKPLAGGTASAGEVGAAPGPIAPAGWYSNPDGSPSKRWWSGTAWTDAVSVDPSPAMPGSPYGAWFPVQRKTNGFAVASLVCSLGGIFTAGLSGILGVVFGFVARSKIRQSNGYETGDGMALAGIIVGFLMAALFIVLVIALGQIDQSGTG